MSSLTTMIVELQMGAYLLVRHRYLIKAQMMVRLSCRLLGPDPQIKTKVQDCRHFLPERRYRRSLDDNQCRISQTCRQALRPALPNWLA